MRLMGEQFVTGQTIDEALANSRRCEARGFRYSYDMLGEAAVTAGRRPSATIAAYEHAIHAIGKRVGAGAASTKARASRSSSRRCIRATARSQHRARDERALSAAARRSRCWRARYDIGLNIDAEEADRLELSLDLLEALCFDPELAGWNGIGFVVQAYQKRCPFVIDWLIDLARRTRHRLMVRLVKGAYWDSEIKRAQVDGLDGFPGLHAQDPHRRFLSRLRAQAAGRARCASIPQFATHNAQTLAAIHRHRRPNYIAASTSSSACTAWASRCTRRSSGRDKLNRPCRIYAPVGTHETLLAYLVRRLLENGANTSFVNRIADPDCPIDELMADPVERGAGAAAGRPPHRRIAAAARPVRRRARAIRRARPLRTSSVLARARRARDGAGPAGAARSAAGRATAAARECAIRPIARRRRHGASRRRRAGRRGAARRPQPRLGCRRRARATASPRRRPPGSAMRR